MHLKQFDLPPINADQPTRRATTEPTEGYVLDPWSGLYVETQIAYRSRLAQQELA